tara:strand:- start:209 stop:487 length:279 start_codon:yes stop_codon:yes gene_type:complete
MEAPERKMLKATSHRLTLFLGSATQNLEQKIQATEQVIREIDSLALRKEAQEREDTLKPTYSQKKICRKRFLNEAVEKSDFEPFPPPAVLIY